MKNIGFIFLMLSTQLAFGQIKNGGFEIWDTTYKNSYSTDLTNLFGVANPSGGVVRYWTSSTSAGISRTTDSYSGNYSLILHNWYGYAYASINYHDSINFRPQFLQGFFKYITGGANGLANRTAYITLTRFNGISNDTLAYDAFLFDSTTNFKAFQFKLNYLSSLTPDSIDILIINAFPPCASNSICNLLYLDNLVLSNSPLSIKNIIEDEDLVSLFPNPTSNELNFKINSTKLFHLTLYDSKGEKIMDKILSNSSNRIDLSTYSSGIYYYKLISDRQQIKCGKIIRQ
ncbi:MAG: T9SS type A sorting domain-containing protein [Saprospiraceae bacterium]